MWFERWITQGYTALQLAQQSGHSISTIRRIIDYWLKHPPHPNNSDLTGFRHLIFDGTFLDRRKGIFAVMDAKSFSVIHGAPEMAEGPAHLQAFCATLTQQGLLPTSATIDGNPHLVRILRDRWPNMVIQRCLVHIQRQGLSWCRRSPKRTDAKHLRALFLTVMSIRTGADRDRFVAQVHAWEQQYGQRMASSAEHGWIFSDLKRARSMLLAALPNMFRYLEDPVIPTSTNALEGYFARLKQRYRQHRGLVHHHQSAYFRWFLALSPR